MRKTLIISAATLAISGCVSSSSFQAPSPNHNYGAAPIYSEPEVKSVMEVNLKDPDSAKYRFGSPVKAHCNNGILSGGNVVWAGWVVPVQQNAKNSYGAYVGYEGYYARFEGDNLLEVSKATNPNTLIWNFTPKLGIGCLLSQE